MLKRFMRILGCVIMLSFVIMGIYDANAATTELIEVEEPVFFTTETVSDNSKKEGVIETKQEGKNGSKIVTYSVTNKYGKEISKVKKSEKVTTPAQNKIIIKGTKKVYTCSDGTEYDSLDDKNECEKKLEWAKQRDASLQECYADSSKFDCWYDEYPGTTLHWSYWVYDGGGGGGGNGRTGAICRDGWRSYATGRGACSHHGGVSYWLY